MLKKLGIVDDYIVTIQSSTKRNIKKISLVHDGVEIATIVGSFFKFQNIKFFQLSRIWIEPKFRGKSIMRKFLEFLKNEWCIQFISDRDLTPAGLMIWRRFKQDWSAVIYNSDTGGRIDWTDSKEKELFVPEDEYEKVRNDVDHPINRKAQIYYIMSESEIMNKYFRDIPYITNPVLIR